MKLIIRFLKPHWKLCIITVLLMTIDMICALLIPTIAANMLNMGSSASTDFNTLVIIGIKMAVVAVIAGAAGILGGYACARLAARVGADIREALYIKTPLLSKYKLTALKL